MPTTRSEHTKAIYIRTDVFDELKCFLAAFKGDDLAAPQTYWLSALVHWAIENGDPEKMFSEYFVCSPWPPHMNEIALRKDK